MDPLLIRSVVDAWNEGLTFTQVAKRCSITKGSVAGIVRRARLLYPDVRRGVSPIKPAKKAASKAPKPERLPKATVRKESPPPLSSRYRCQYIAGEPSPDDACKCLKPTLNGSSYCPEHHKLCNVRPDPPKPRSNLVPSSHFSPFSKLTFNT